MRALVTGGAGFLGRWLSERLLAEGHEVRALDLPSPGLEDLRRQGVETVAGDVRDADAVKRAVEGAEVVFHAAALAAPVGKRSEFWAINVTGTEIVIAACQGAGVRRLVQVSSPSAVFDGSDHIMADESLPYPKHFLSLYCETKAASEQRALAANGPELETVAIRPHAMWGPRDRHLLPRIIRRARAGRLFQIGNGRNLVSPLYVENAVDGLLLAGRAPAAAGKVYFLTDAEPVVLWEFVRRVLRELKLPGPRGAVPYPVAYWLGALAEAAWALFPGRGEPVLTRYSAAEVARTHTYSIERARRELGYEPRVSGEEGLRRVLSWFEEHGLPA